jgi:hypothetical protein
VGGVGEEAPGCGVACACFLDGFFEGVDHLVEGGGEAAELGVGAAWLEAQLGVAVGDAGRGFDDSGEWAQSGARALKDEHAGEQQRGGGDQELDEKEVGDCVVDARAAGAERDPRPVREDLIEDEQRSARLDGRGAIGRSGGGGFAADGGVMRMAIPSSARPGRSRFACPAERACSTDAPALASRLWRSPSSLAR